MPRFSDQPKGSLRPTSAAHRLRDAVLAAVLGAGAVAWVVFPGGLMVETPSFGQPEILTPGEEVEVVTRAAVPWFTRIEGLTLERGPIRIPVPLQTATGRGARPTALGRLPSDCPPGNYDLVARAGTRESRARRAVAVLASIPERFTVAQITDLHVGYTPEGEASVGRIVDELDRLKPDLVVVTGDITDDGNWDHFERAQRVLDKLTMPFVCVPGNHDRRGFAGYLSSFGLPYYSVKFGHWTLLGLDGGHGWDQFTESQFAFIGRELDAAQPGRVIVLSHIPLAGKRSIKAHAGDAIALLERKHVPLVLSGHWHYGGGYEAANGTPIGAQTGTQFVTTAASGGWPHVAPNERLASRGFTLVTVDNGRVASVEYCGFDSGAAREANQ
ncbi:MAG: hypothetical protein C3F15_05325 [Holophagae bacterium]|nr:MAG: hypothetical protein C3F15_05325 [Holophagae bacterium]